MATETGVPLRHVFSVTSGGTPSSSRAEFWDGDILWITSEDLSDSSEYWLRDTRRKITDAGYMSCGATLAPANSIVLSKRAPIGQLAVLADPACSSQGCLLLTPTGKADSRYYYYWLRSRVGDLHALARGSTFTELGADDLKSLRLACPPIRSQRRIADYLDRETSRFDALVAEKERVLDLLAEKRRALITDAVTRGLDPAAPVGGSGTTWLGDVPSHWTRCHLKRALDSLDYGVSDPVNSSGKVAVLRMGDLRNGSLDYSAVGFVEEVDDDLLLQPGDLLYNRTNSLDQIGKVALFRGNSDYPVSFASYLVRLRCGSSVLPEFLNWLLNSAFVVAWVRAEALPAIGQVNLNPNRLGYLPVALPPRIEQECIVSFLDSEVRELDAVRSATVRTIALLKERRFALIAAAVTGQIDVGHTA